MPKLYEALADAFLAEGVDTQFVLMGDGNMHLVYRLPDRRNEWHRPEFEPRTCPCPPCQP